MGFGLFVTCPLNATDEGLSPGLSPNISCSPFLVDDPEFDFELKRTLTSMYSGGSDLGEVIATAARIDPLTYENWYYEWTKTADHFRDVGDEAFENGHFISAPDAWLRAQTYYRTAEFFLHNNPEDPRIISSWKNSVDTFRNAMDLD